MVGGKTICSVDRVPRPPGVSCIIYAFWESILKVLFFLFSMYTRRRPDCFQGNVRGIGAAPHSPPALRFARGR